MKNSRKFLIVFPLHRREHTQVGGTGDRGKKHQRKQWDHLEPTTDAILLVIGLRDCESLD